MDLKQDSSIKRDLKNRENTYHGIYSDVGNILDNYSTQELMEYFVNDIMKGNDSILRDFLERQIISDEINKDRFKNDIRYTDRLNNAAQQHMHGKAR